MGLYQLVLLSPVGKCCWLLERVQWMSELSSLHLLATEQNTSLKNLGGRNSFFYQKIKPSCQFMISQFRDQWKDRAMSCFFSYFSARCMTINWSCQIYHIQIYEKYNIFPTIFVGVYFFLFLIFNLELFSVWYNEVRKSFQTVYLAVVPSNINWYPVYTGSYLLV